MMSNDDNNLLIIRIVAASGSAQHFVYNNEIIILYRLYCLYTILYMQTTTENDRSEAEMKMLSRKRTKFALQRMRSKRDPFVRSDLSETIKFHN